MRCPACGTRIVWVDGQFVTSWQIKADPRPLDCGHCGAEVWSGRLS